MRRRWHQRSRQPGRTRSSTFLWLPYFFSTGHRRPVPGPVKTPVFMHSAKALSQELLSNFLVALALLIPCLQPCAPIEHDVGCRWAEAAEGTRSIAAAMSSLYIAMG